MSTNTAEHWIFDPDRSDGGVWIDLITMNMPEITPGSRFDAEFIFQDGIHDPGASEGQIPRYESVREYTQYAGRYTLNPALDGTNHVVDRTPASGPVESIIVKLDPGPDLEHTPPLWIAIDSVQDLTRDPQARCRLRIRGETIVQGDKYATRSDLISSIGTDLH